MKYNINTNPLLPTIWIKSVCRLSYMYNWWVIMYNDTFLNNKDMDASFIDINLLDFNSISSFGYIYTHTRFYFSAVTLHFEWALKLLFLWIVQKPTKHETHSRSNKYSKIESTQFKNQGRRLKTASRFFFEFICWSWRFLVSYFKK